MPKVKKIVAPPKVNTTRGAELLKEYQRLLDQKILDLRAEACRLAALSREIDTLIPDEQLQAIAEQKEADKAWSMQSDQNLQFGVNNVLELLSDAK